jgi:hypothetical protein
MKYDEAPRKALIVGNKTHPYCCETDFMRLSNLLLAAGMLRFVSLRGELLMTTYRDRTNLCVFGTERSIHLGIFVSLRAEFLRYL